jgi:hypothetical protein
MPNVAFVTCSRLPELDSDDVLVVEPLRALGIDVTPAVWDDPSVDWDSFDLSVIRSTWDYTDRRDAFVAWASSVPRLLNPANVIAWNTDKRYLAELSAAGLPVVETTWITPETEIGLPTAGEYVLKPSIGAGSIDAQRFDLFNSDALARAAAHVERLLGKGQTVMLQPFVKGIEDRGETSVILVDGDFSHAIRKGVMLGPTTLDEVDDLYKEETITARTPSDEEVELARAAVAAIPVDSGPLLYARVDMVPGADGRPILMELELTEPSLFMSTSPGSEMGFAKAIARRAKKEAGRAPQRGVPGLSRRAIS